ncbi:hypothetical protein X798_06787 [Onchocerca flexuosa]|uniref:Costars domain-containing protein n=1 Tax=Onchocerca flexuosa TaxID=387005 RepID=A0A238BMG0_9BILA|nr:hypothetical protein X798_06787 [Onchocerca flexuosa]
MQNKQKLTRTCLLVGMLIRARKYKLVDFEGEMLYQRQDDDKIIRLLKPIEEIRKLEPSVRDAENFTATSEEYKERMNSNF